MFCKICGKVYYVARCHTPLRDLSELLLQFCCYRNRLNMLDKVKYLTTDISGIFLASSAFYLVLIGLQLVLYSKFLVYSFLLHNCCASERSMKLDQSQNFLCVQGECHQSLLPCSSLG